jgi:hypothetical protein
MKNKAGNKNRSHGGEPVVILDFFGGSGTTGHAVMQKNAEDGGNRKYIIVQSAEPTNPKSAAAKAGYKTVDEITMERLKRAAKKIGEGQGLFAGGLDLGLKHYICKAPEDVDDKSKIVDAAEIRRAAGGRKMKCVCGHEFAVYGADRRECGIVLDVGNARPVDVHVCPKCGTLKIDGRDERNKKLFWIEQEEKN